MFNFFKKDRDQLNYSGYKVYKEFKILVNDYSKLLDNDTIN